LKKRSIVGLVVIPIDGVPSLLYYFEKTRKLLSRIYFKNKKRSVKPLLINKKKRIKQTKG